MDTVAPLAEALADESVRARSEAMRLLERIAPIEKDAVVSALVEVLEMKGRPWRRLAAWVLATVGPGAKAAVPALVAAIKEDDAHLIAEAISALKRIVEDWDTLPDLAELIRERSHLVQMQSRSGVARR